MLFGLKNAGASFQGAITKIFIDQIGGNLEAYMDDIVAKSMAFALHLEQLEETFTNLRIYNMRLNP